LGGVFRLMRGEFWPEVKHLSLWPPRFRTIQASPKDLPVLPRQAQRAVVVHAAVARPEARHPDQPLDLSLVHRGEEDSRRVGEKLRRPKDDFGPGSR
jgi:hypothetical protein